MILLCIKMTSVLENWEIKLAEQQINEYYDGFEQEYQHRNFDIWKNTPKEKFKILMKKYLHQCFTKVTDKLFDKIFNVHKDIARIFVTKDFDMAQYTWYGLIFELHPAHESLPKGFVDERLSQIELPDSTTLLLNVREFNAIAIPILEEDFSTIVIHDY